jgi:cysteine-rich repeat protein
LIGAAHQRAEIAALALAHALSAFGCNAIAGIDEPRLDPCINNPGGGCHATTGSGSGGSGTGGATTGPTSSAISSSSTGPAQPVCGNGVIEMGEQCDDGNTNDGDGCSSHCQVECMGLGLYLDPMTFHCYRVVGMQLEWGQARDACLAAHEHLATFTSPMELDAVDPHVPGQVWIDGERSGQAFVWDDGEPWSFERWKGGSPPDDPSKGCVKLDGGQFNVDDCTAKLGYVCERDPAGT